MIVDEFECLERIARGHGSSTRGLTAADIFKIVKQQKERIDRLEEILAGDTANRKAYLRELQKLSVEPQEIELPEQRHDGMPKIA